MDDKLEQCSNCLKDEIKDLEICIVDTNNHLNSAADESVEGLEARWKKAKVKYEAKREQAGQARQRIGQFLDRIKEDLVAKYEDWKTDREIEKLEKNADKKEQQAVDAVIVAAFALLEVEVAIVEALKARKIAVEVAG